MRVYVRVCLRMCVFSCVRACVCIHARVRVYVLACVYHGARVHASEESENELRCIPSGLHPLPLYVYLPRLIPCWPQLPDKVVQFL